MSNPVHVQPTPRSHPLSLASGPISCAAGQETVLKSVVAQNGGFPYLSSLAYYVDGAATLIEFRVYVGGVLATFPNAKRSTQIGEIGNPQRLSAPHELPPGVAVEIRAYNGEASGFTCECDGEIEDYARPIR